MRARCMHGFVWLVACSAPAAHVQLAPIDFGTTCGKPSSTVVRVIAYAPSGDARRTDTEIADFPADTVQLAVEVLGGNGVVLATGKTAPLDYNDLADKTEIPIAMVPLDGFCALPGMNVVRAHPLVAHAGGGVLVVGGDQPGADNVTHSTAEYYDPATATFTPVKVPSVIDGNQRVFANGALAELPDGRVVISGDAALTTFDPITRTFSEPSLVDVRDQHAALGIDPTHMLVTGGCTPLNKTCDVDAVVLRSSLVYEIGSDGKTVGDPIAQPALPAGSVRFGGHLFDLGVTTDGKRRLMVAGAPSDPTTADALPFSTPDNTSSTSTVQHLFSQVTELDGGALLSAFDPDGTAVPTGPATITPPEGGDGIDVAIAPAITGARLVTTEDGTAVAIGGQPGISRYQPTTNTWSQLPPTDPANWPGAITGPSLIRLADGSVLVLPGAEPSSRAWLFRPSIVGPYIGEVTAYPNGMGAVLTTPAPATATRTPTTLTLTAPDDGITARALIGGPRRAYGTLAASISVTAGGVALIAQQTGPARALVARLVPGEAARIERHDGADITIVCSGAMVDVGELQSVGLSVTADAITASIDGIVKVSCDAAKDPNAPESGAWGIAATANGSLGIVTLTATR
ncbi:MAG: hypothetical protein ABI591_28475 [Kofleriaceae bacterium]